MDCTLRQRTSAHQGRHIARRRDARPGIASPITLLHRLCRFAYGTARKAVSDAQFVGPPGPGRLPGARHGERACGPHRRGRRRHVGPAARARVEQRRPPAVAAQPARARGRGAGVSPARPAGHVRAGRRRARAVARRRAHRRRLDGALPAARRRPRRARGRAHGAAVVGPRGAVDDVLAGAPALRRRRAPSDAARGRGSRLPESTRRCAPASCATPAWRAWWRPGCRVASCAVPGR